MRLTRHDTLWLLAVVSLLLSGSPRGDAPPASAPPASARAEQAGDADPRSEVAATPGRTPRDPAPVATDAPRRAVPRSTPPPSPAVLGRPARVRAPAVGIDAPIVSLGTAPDGTLEVPSEPGHVGWWADGVRPGGHGPAVLAGHVDWTDGPAVFHRLRELRVGDVVEVEGDDGQRLAFTVTQVTQVSKDGFPTAQVYGPTDAPTLRLITCGGAFDRTTGHYVDNVVVTAEWRPPAD